MLTGSIFYLNKRDSKKGFHAESRENDIADLKKAFVAEVGVLGPFIVIPASCSGGVAASIWAPVLGALKLLPQERVSTVLRNMDSIQMAPPTFSPRHRPVRWDDCNIKYGCSAGGENYSLEASAAGQ